MADEFRLKYIVERTRVQRYRRFARLLADKLGYTSEMSHDERIALLEHHHGFMPTPKESAMVPEFPDAEPVSDPGPAQFVDNPVNPTPFL